MEKNTYWNNNGKYNHEYEILWRRLVPAEGKANTVAGEVLRAVSRLYYRWYNDGDRVTPSVDSWRSRRACSAPSISSTSSGTPFPDSARRR